MAFLQPHTLNTAPHPDLVARLADQKWQRGVEVDIKQKNAKCFIIVKSYKVAQSTAGKLSRTESTKRI